MWWTEVRAVKRTEMLGVRKKLLGLWQTRLCHSVALAFGLCPCPTPGSLTNSGRKKIVTKEKRDTKSARVDGQKSRD